MKTALKLILAALWLAYTSFAVYALHEAKRTPCVVEPPPGCAAEVSYGVVTTRCPHSAR